MALDFFSSFYLRLKRKTNNRATIKNLVGREICIKMGSFNKLWLRLWSYEKNSSEQILIKNAIFIKFLQKMTNILITCLGTQYLKYVIKNINKEQTNNKSHTSNIFVYSLIFTSFIIMENMSNQMPLTLLLSSKGKLHIFSIYFYEEAFILWLWIENHN